eukprot:scaffold1860_cov403-Prasinococcus_capsulatus_cf.AAC.4
MAARIVVPRGTACNRSGIARGAEVVWKQLPLHVSIFATVAGRTPSVPLRCRQAGTVARTAAAARGQVAAGRGVRVAAVRREWRRVVACDMAHRPEMVPSRARGRAQL